MNEHYLKTWPDVFQATWEGKKKFELRKNDRNFAIGELLALREYDPDEEKYSRREIYALVTFILPGGEFGLPPDLCVMNIKVFSKAEGLQAPECTDCQREYVNGRCPKCGYEN